jgi:hypothetical protein
MKLEIDTRMIDAISDISIALKKPADSYSGNVFIWYIDNQEIHLEINEKQLFIADCKGGSGKNLSHKKYLLLEGIGAFYGLTVEMGYLE